MGFLDKMDSINTTRERAVLLVNSVLVYVLGHRHDHTARTSQRFHTIFLHRPHATCIMRTVQVSRKPNNHANATQTSPNHPQSPPLDTAR